VARLLGDPERVEALFWLREAVEEIRSLGECGSREASVELAERIYEAGAEEVWVVDIERYALQHMDGEQRRANSGKLVVRLPTDPGSRRRFFRWEAKHSRSLGFDPRLDEGQTFLFVPLD
jgi:hypothetical protein